MNSQHLDTIVAVSTPPGAGGIAVLRLSGSRAFIIAYACVPKATFAQGTIPPRQAIYTSWLHPEHHEVLDDVILTAFAGPNSYTGEDTIEISCHGSVYVQRVVLQSCLTAGARLAGPGEFTQRAFVNGRLDLAQAEGVGDLIAAETQAAHRLAINQMKGGLSRRMAEMRSELINFAALIELENDFGEEDVSFANRDDLLNRVLALLKEIDTLKQSFAQGQAIREGVTAVIAGRPNAGKSTLLNALLEEDRAIVSEQAGTTRDTIDAELLIKGVKFHIVDTAGIREATDEIEALGVARSLSAVQRASVLIYVWDVVMTTPEECAEDIAKLRQPGTPMLAVANKMDLNPYAKLSHYASAKLDDRNYVPMSAKHDMNIQLLKDRLFEVSVGELPTAGSVVLTQARHEQALSGAEDALQRVQAGLQTDLSGDLLALDLRQALHYIGEVTGEISTDDLLGSIFSSFCIGK